MRFIQFLQCVCAVLFFFCIYMAGKAVDREAAQAEAAWKAKVIAACAEHGNTK